MLTSEWLAFEDVTGGQAAMERAIEKVQKCDWLFLFQNISAFVSGARAGEFLESAIAEKAKIALRLEGPFAGRDFCDGFDHVQARLVDAMVQPGGRRIELLVAGNMFCRHEGDEQGNVAELERMLEECGIENHLVLFDGRDLAPEHVWPEAVAMMPYAGPQTRGVLRAKGLECFELPLPLGAEASLEWVERVCRLAGRRAPGFGQLLDPGRRKLVAVAVLEKLAGLRVVIVGDRPLARALRRLAEELAWEICDVIIMATGGGHESGSVRPPTVESFSSVLERHRPDVVVGSGAMSCVALERRVAFLELGFPSLFTHRFEPRPYLGPRGFANIVEDLLNMRLRTIQKRPYAAPAISRNER
ncbi:MAG: hypothetical protein D6806_17625 [Deltaproteobacteria bacterium]|nr:MAG: hypothetical protein D6806_17625 [Deltaproteobacteria bacterium]